MKEKGLTTGVSASTSSTRSPPFDVSPGHMMLAPASTNLMAPLSTCTFFIMPGSGTYNRKKITKKKLQIVPCETFICYMMIIDHHVTNECGAKTIFLCTLTSKQWSEQNRMPVNALSLNPWGYQKFEPWQRTSNAYSKCNISFASVEISYTDGEAATSACKVHLGY